MNFRTRWSVIGTTLLSLALPSAAELHVENLVVNQSGPSPQRTNIRVNLLNDGADLAKPDRVELKARENPGTAWRTVKTWSGTHYIEAGDRRSFDYLPTPGEGLDPALSQPTYELQVVVSGKSGPMTSFEYHYDPRDKHE